MMPGRPHLAERFPPPLRSLGSRRKAFLIRWSGYLLCVAGIIALGYCGYVISESRLFQVYQNWRFEKLLRSSQAVAPVELPLLIPSPDTATFAPAADSSGPRAGAALGRIEVNRIGMAAMVIEGIDNRTLRRAVGHIPGTALPGATGNVAIAGHRDTFFRGLRDIRKEDEITLTTLRGSYRYRVESMLIVEPHEVWVLEETGQPVLTLVTCYPFNFVGPAPQRFVVRARKISH